MDGPNFSIGAIYGLLLFTVFLILKSDGAWQKMLPYLTLMALAYTTLIIAVTLVLLVVLRIAFDIIDQINELNNQPEGMFFLHKNIVYVCKKTLFKI